MNTNSIIDKEIEYIQNKLKESEEVFCNSYELFKNYFELRGALRELNVLKKMLEGENE